VTVRHNSTRIMSAHRYIPNSADRSNPKYQRPNQPGDVIVDGVGYPPHFLYRASPNDIRIKAYRDRMFSNLYNEDRFGRKYYKAGTGRAFKQQPTPARFASTNSYYRANPDKRGLDMLYDAAMAVAYDDLSRSQHRYPGDIGKTVDAWKAIKRLRM
jgi:hypothetical protein